MTIVGASLSLGIGTLALLFQLRDDPVPYGLVAGIVTLLLTLSVRLLLASLTPGRWWREILISVGAGLVVAVLSQVVRTEVAAAPILAAAIVAGIVAWSILARRHRFARWLSATFRVTPMVAAICAVLAVVPVVQVVLELIVHPTTASELVDSRGASGATIVSVDSFAILLPFPAEPPPGARPEEPNAFHWYVLRDSTRDPRLVLLRSPVSLEALRTRTIVARVVDDPGAVDGALAAIADRRGTKPATPVTRFLLDEVAGPVDGVNDLRSLADASTVAVGDLVRVRIQIEGGVASCVPRADCRARGLAAGDGSWDNLVSGSAGEGWAVVRTGYPPTVAPFHGVGQMLRDRELISRVLAEPGVRSVLGWGRALRVGLVDHDPSLPVDHLWLGPIAFVLAAGLLVVGRRIGYPLFRAGGSAGVGAGRLVPSAAVLSCRASGRITPPNGSPFEVDDHPATLRSHPGGGSELRLEGADGRREVIIPRGLGGLGATEIGDLVMVNRTLPALMVNWFGNNLLLAFSDYAARDTAAALVRHG